MNLTYDKLLSNVAFNFNLRHYNLEVVDAGTGTPLDWGGLGGALQLDPRLTPSAPCMLATLETKT